MSTPPVGAISVHFDHLKLNSRPLQGLLCLLCAALLLYPSNHVVLLIGWAALVALLLTALDWLQRGYLCSDDRTHPRWPLLYHGNLATLAGAVSLGVILLAPGQPALKLLIYLLLSACVATATLAYARATTLLLAFTAPLLAPLSGYLLLQPDLQAQIWGCAFLALFIASLLGANRVHQHRQKTARAIQQNRLLSEQLEQLKQAQQQARKAQIQTALAATKPAARYEQAPQTGCDHEKQARRHKMTLNALRSTQEHLNQALDASSMGLWDWDLQHNRVSHSRLQALLGYQPEQLQNSAQQLQALIHPDDLPAVRRTLVIHLRGRSDLYRVSYRIRHALGHWCWFEDQGRAIAWDAQGNIIRLTGTRRDISHERAFQQQARLAHTVFQSSNEGIFILDNSFRLQAINRSCCRILQREESQLLGKRLDQSSQLRAQNPALMHRIMRDLKRGMSWQGNFPYQRLDGQQVNLWVQLHGVRDPDGVINQYAGVIADQSQIEQTQERLQYLAKYDSLTGLANRAHFNSALTQALQQAKRNQQQLSLLLIDLDRFKQINTSLGHQQGDHLLQVLAKRMLDAPLPFQLVARLSSDEFALVTECDLDREQLQQLPEKLQTLLSQPIALAGENLSCSASIGLCHYPDQADNLQSLVNQAGRALSYAEERGGGCWELYAPHMQQNPHQRLRQEQALRRALEQKELRVHYQAKLSLAQNRVTSAEALVRWHHPEEGIIGPDQFITLAEETGLIAQIGDQVLEQSIAQASHWYQHGHWLTVAVNLSAPQLQQEQLAERLQQLLQRYQLPAELLELELTESQLLADGPRHIALLQQIRELGIKVSIDDFGTGYSSLSYLKNLPVDGVKIDQSFIRDILSNSDDLAISRAIIALAHGLNLRVTAEGAETAAHLQLLRGLDVDQVQGYFISRPLQADLFAERFLFQESATDRLLCKSD